MSQAPYGPMPTAPPPWHQQGPPTPHNPSRLLGILTALLALVALGFALAAWVRSAPKPEAAPVYSEQQVADAKKAVCDAFSQTQDTLRVTGGKKGSDQTETFIVALNSRIAIQTVSARLLSVLSGAPAASEDLTDAVTGLADVYQQTLLKQLAEEPRPSLEPLYKELDARTERVKQACG